MQLLQIINQETAEKGFVLFDKLNIKFAVRLAADLLTVFILIRFIYYRLYKRSDLFLTFFGFNLVIFLITFLLNKVEMTMGAAFGLFAVFSTLRYRTENISAKDMTYLFVSIAVGLIMAVSRGGWDELILLGLIVIVTVQLLDGTWLMRRELSQIVYYENIHLVQAGKRNELIEDLKNKTGLEIKRVDINRLDFLKDSAILTVYYYENKKP
ncbi:MAG: DUF4956 domain-containing protein [Lacibacter sp.]